MRLTRQVRTVRKIIEDLINAIENLDAEVQEPEVNQKQSKYIISILTMITEDLDAKIKVIKYKIEWTMFKDILLFNKVFAKVMKFSKVLIHIRGKNAEVRRRAAQLHKTVRTTGKSRDPRVEFIAMKLNVPGVSFEKVIKMIDDIVTLLGKDQAEDDLKKEYCTSEIGKAEDEIKELKHAADIPEKDDRGEE